MIKAICISALLLAHAFNPALAQSYDPFTSDAIAMFSGVWVKTDIPASPDAAALDNALSACDSPPDLYDSSYLEGGLETVAMTNMRKMAADMPGIENAEGDLFFLQHGNDLAMATPSWLGFWPDAVTLFRYGVQEKEGGVAYTLHRDKAWKSGEWEKTSGTEVFLFRRGKASSGTDIRFMAHPYDAWADDPWGTADHYVKCA